MPSGVGWPVTIAAGAPPVSGTRHTDPPRTPLVQYTAPPSDASAPSPHCSSTRTSGAPPDSATRVTAPCVGLPTRSPLGRSLIQYTWASPTATAPGNARRPARTTGAPPSPDTRWSVPSPTPQVVKKTCPPRTARPSAPVTPETTPRGGG